MNNIEKTTSLYDINKEAAELDQIVKFALAHANALGSSQAEVSANSNNGFSINVRMGEVDTVEFQRDKSLAVDVYFGKKKGSASTSDLSQAAVEQAVKAACDIAQYTSEDPCNGLAEKSLMAFNFPDVDAYHPWEITPEQAIELAKRCEADGRAYDKRIHNSEGASVSTSAGSYVYGNSHGFIGEVPSTRHSISCTLVAEDSSGMQRDGDYTTARDAADLLTIDVLAKQAAERTVARLQGRSISTRKTPVLFAAETAKSIIACLISAVSGGNLYRQTSFLLNSLDKQILPAWMNMIEKPHMKKALGSSAFDNEGVLTREQALIQNGVLQHYVLGSYSARKLGLQTTANAGGVNNLIIEANNLSFTELLKQMHTGFVITEMIGNGVNITTGDYSRGAAGFWVENGEIQFPVEEVTIAGNLKDMLQGIEAVANDVDKRGNICTGSILINQMTLAGR